MTMPNINFNNFLLYSSYLLTSIEDRAWSFAVALTMQELGGMRLVSIEQFAEGLSCMAFSGALGKYCDDVTRKIGISTVIPMNNFSLLASCVAFVTCLSLNESSNKALYTILLVIGMILCAVNRLGINQEKNCLGRDWVIVLSQGDKLSKLNAILLTVDQLANVISPLVIGGLVSLINLRTVLIIFGVYSCGSIILKVIVLNILLTKEPRLLKKQQKANFDEKSLKKSKNGFFTVIGVFWRQRIFSAALGMALLFMTVLGFDGLAIGYGQSVGLPDSLIGGFRSFGSLCGILGAIFYAYFDQLMGVRKTGVFGLTFQQIFLLLAISSIFMPGSPTDLRGYFDSLTADKWWSDFKDSFAPVSTIAPVNSTDTGIDWKNFKSNGHSMMSIFAFLIGIATARFGLWMADLAITQVMQEGVEEGERNTVFGVHNALCQTFSVLKDVMVILLPEPSTFAICMVISYLFVFSGFLAYIYYLLKTRNDPRPIKASIYVEDEDCETEKL
ncbi:unnamed protein product, partial [Mesorhabditis belari]|uniref:Solute carrier family 40 member n=1 Tax=Mesorhabditis belari TaxID=2138241 RepID=A0AAF3J6H6_9BILA